MEIHGRLLYYFVGEEIVKRAEPMFTPTLMFLAFLPLSISHVVFTFF